MENSAVTSKKQTLEFGLFYGLMVILFFVIIYVLNIDPIENPAISTFSSICSYFIFPVLFILLAINNYKKSNHGFISLGESIKTGVKVAFIAALVFSVFNLIFNFIFPEYTQQILDQSKHIMMKQNPNMTKDQLETAVAMTKKFTSPVFSIPLMLLVFTFLGLIYSLIIGLIVRKDQPNFN